MKILENYTDANVLKETKIYIKENMSKGDSFTPAKLQKLYNIGYNKANRILSMLSNENVIKFDKNKFKAPKVL